MDFPVPKASKWFNRPERLIDEPFEDVVYDEPRPGRPSKLSESASAVRG